MASHRGVPSVTGMTITTDAAKRANTHTVRLQGGGLRFLDAPEVSQEEFRVVTRPLRRFDTSQHWRITDLEDGTCTIQQVSSGRFLDAHQTAGPDFCAVTVAVRDADTQRWRIDDFGGGFATIQQVSSGRFLEAKVDGEFNVVARLSPSSEQTWRFGTP